MLARLIKYSYSLQELRYHEDTQQFIQNNFIGKKKESPEFFHFHLTAQPTLLQRLFPINTKHSSLLQLYLDFIQRRQQAPQDIAYQFIEQNLRKKVLSELSKSGMRVRVDKGKVLKSQMIQKTQLMGVFIHRRYNLNLQSYKVDPKRINFINYELKTSLRSQALRIYESLIRQYKANNMEESYGSSLRDFVKEKSIYRYLFDMTIDLKLTLEKDGKEVQLGHRGITRHILQIQSHFAPYSKVEQFYLTDVDFILQGNPFFRQKLYL